MKSAAVGAGLATLPGVATAKSRGGPPCHKDFECDDSYVKFEFVEADGCSFEEETDEGLVTVDSYTSKDGGHV